MEIITTMIEFRCAKANMKIQSRNAQLFSFKAKDEKKIDIWVPQSKLLIKEDPVADDYNLCVMPKWVFYKSGNLSDNVEIVSETQHLETVEEI